MIFWPVFLRILPEVWSKNRELWGNKDTGFLPLLEETNRRSSINNYEGRERVRKDKITDKINKE